MTGYLGFSLKTEIYQQNITSLPSSSSSSNRDRKDLHDQDNRDGVITHLEPDILECEVKWALESITTKKASLQPKLVEVMKFQLSYFKS